MNDDQIKETLINIRNIQNHTWAGMLLCFSGSLGLIFAGKGILAWLFSGIGFMLGFWLLNVYLIRNEAIDRITNEKFGGKRNENR